jgi:hypothetical protein
MLVVAEAAAQAAEVQQDQVAEELELQTLQVVTDLQILAEALEVLAQLHLVLWTVVVVVQV